MAPKAVARIAEFPTERRIPRGPQEALIAEWIFSCTWQGKAVMFEGATIAGLAGEKIAYLREYATSAPLYDWTGTWRE